MNPSASTVSRDCRWRCERFDALTVAELHAIMALRQRVFVVEQRCAYLDADEHDRHATHLWATLDESSSEALQVPEAPRAPSRLVAVARIFAPGIKFAESTLGRVATAPEHRNVGLGRALVRFALERIEALWGLVPVRISAQAHLERFYGEFGFRVASERYLEDDIPHIAMVRAAPTRELR
jgi:ElaA protein